MTGEVEQRGYNLDGGGWQTYSASATDNAGNTGHGFASFSVTVTVTFTSLAALVTRFSTDPAGPVERRTVRSPNRY